MSTRSLFTKNAARAGFAAAALAAGVAGFSVTSAVAQDAPEDAPQEEEARDGENCNGRRGHHGEALAEIIGIEVDALREALQSGQTPTEVAEDNGVSRDELVSGLEEAMNERLTEAVEDGRLTQEEADEKAAEISDRANSIADGERPEGPRGPRGPRGPDGPVDDADQDADTEEGTA